jgi:hypothetical protein
MDFTLADIVRVSGAKRRSIQLWADAGVIRAYTSTERRGTGTHRRFSRDEAIIASIINVFNRRQVAIGELQRLSHGLRKLLNSGKNRKDIELAISQAEPRYLIVTWQTEKTPDVDVCELDTIEEKIGWEMGQEFEVSILISLHWCLSGLREKQ